MPKSTAIPEKSSTCLAEQELRKMFRKKFRMPVGTRLTAEYLSVKVPHALQYNNLRKSSTKVAHMYKSCRKFVSKSSACDSIHTVHCIQYNNPRKSSIKVAHMYVL